MQRHAGFSGRAAAVFSSMLGWAMPLRAEVVQSDAAQTPLPQPVRQAEWELVTNSWAYRSDTRVARDEDGSDIFDQGLTFGDFYPAFEDGAAITLEGLFKWRGEALDAVLDAASGPGYFTPSCGLRAELVLRGGDCRFSLGWYNIDDPEAAETPEAAEIYELFPSDYEGLLNCAAPLDNGFCPLAWDNVDPRNLSHEMWQPVAFTLDDLGSDSRYDGGYIGFALLANPASSCSANKYSLPGHNQRNAQGDPWVTVLQYRSSVDENGFYLAFEDLPMSAADWTVTGIQGSLATSEGDFNDVVFYVSGAECELCAGDCSDSDTGGSGGSSGGGSGDNSTSVGGSGGADGSSVGGSAPLGNSSDTTGSNAGGAGGATSATSASSGDPSGSGGTNAAGGAGPSSCTPGRQVDCSCANGEQGAQICSDAGDRYLPCICDAANGGSAGEPPSMGMGGSSAGDPGTNDAGGCGCRMPSTGQVDPRGMGLWLLGAGWAVGRRQRARAMVR